MLKTRTKPIGIQVLLFGLVALILTNVLARFNLVDFTGYQPDILTLVAILFVATEIGVMSALKRKHKLDMLGWVGVGIVGVSFLSLVLGWAGTSISFIDTWQGLVDTSLLIFVVIEIFR